nr:NYN domain-containing protein [Bradyrhizobium sp. NBAIM32]
MVAGDSDYVPVVEKLIERGFKVEVAFWGQAARELRQAAANFFELDGKLDEFTRAAPQAAA